MCVRLRSVTIKKWNLNMRDACARRKKRSQPTFCHNDLSFDIARSLFETWPHWRTPLISNKESISNRISSGRPSKWKNDMVVELELSILASDDLGIEKRPNIHSQTELKKAFTSRKFYVSRFWSRKLKWTLVLMQDVLTGYFAAKIFPNSFIN